MYSQCFTQQRVAETVSWDKKSLINGFACEMVFQSLTVAQSTKQNQVLCNGIYVCVSLLLEGR
jgi:hypothetical protein